MALLPSHQPEGRRRKRPKRSRHRACGLIACAVLALLGYLGYTRAAGADGSGGSSGRRRDLKEQGAVLAAAAGDADVSAPDYRGPGQVETFPAQPGSTRLLLATHSRLLWYRYDTEELTTLHEGQGVYYGGFPGERRTPAGSPATLWVASRPHNWRPAGAKEWLLELDAGNGTELRRVALPSRFAHDVVRRRGRAYVASTGTGEVVELSFPAMRVLRRLSLFTEQEHVNTLSPTANGTMWAMLHNLGPSALVEVDLRGGSVVRRLEGVGEKSHGAVIWTRGDGSVAIVSLDSDTAALVTIDPATGAATRLWSAPESRRYLKGLCVVDGIAFFGVAETRERRDRDSPDLNCELAAFDLQQGLLLWRRQLPTRGLLNVVAAPHLQVESTAYAVEVAERAAGYRATPAYARALAVARATHEALQEAAFAANGGAQQQQEAAEDDGGGAVTTRPPMPTQADVTDEQGAGGLAGAWDGSEAPGAPKKTLLELEPLPDTDPLAQYPPVVRGCWASGYPRLDLQAKGGRGLSSGAQLPLFRADIAALRAQLLSLPVDDWKEAAQRASNAWLTGRSANLENIKPGVKSIHLVFSDHAGQEVFEFPWYRERFAALVDPLLIRLLGDDVANIIRLQLAYMPPNSSIKSHIDTGGYSEEAHRIHAVLSSSPAVSFHVCEKEACVPLHCEQGLVFELNNRLRHYVDNMGDEPRVHLLVDVAEAPRERRELARGQVCNYAGRIECPDDDTMREE